MYLYITFSDNLFGAFCEIPVNGGRTDEELTMTSVNADIQSSSARNVHNAYNKSNETATTANQ